MTKVNLKNGHETKSDIFPWDMFKSVQYLFYQKIWKYFNDFENQNFTVFKTTVNRSNPNQTKI